jgi:hypothetical protein
MYTPCTLLARLANKQDLYKQEVQELERKMRELEFEREERCRRIMHRRVQQVNTLQELGRCLYNILYFVHRRVQQVNTLQELGRGLYNILYFGQKKLLIKLCADNLKV